MTVHGSCTCGGRGASTRHSRRPFPVVNSASECVGLSYAMKYVTLLEMIIAAMGGVWLLRPSSFCILQLLDVM